MTHNVNINKGLVFLSDILLFLLSYLLAFFIRYGHQFPEKNTDQFLKMLPLFLLVFVFLSFAYDAYSEYANFSDKLVSLMCIVSLTTLASLALSFIFYQFAIPRIFIAISALLQLALLGAWRYIAGRMGLLLRRPKQAMIVGQPSEITDLMNSINYFLAQGLIIDKELHIAGEDDFDQRWTEITRQTGIEKIEIIIICSSVSKEKRKQIVAYCIQSGKTVMVVPDVYDIMLQHSRLVSAGDIPIIQLQGLLAPAPMSYFKRIMDILLSAIGMLISLPLCLLIILIIKADSPGDAIFSQIRTGVNGKKFKLYKFRTMAPDAEKVSGPVLTAQNDPRITGVGRILRQTRLDEIPQLWNVFVGDMSLVGPRPERPYFVDKYCEDLPEFEYRHYVKGGITGLAQVEGRYSTEPDKKLTYDLIYAQNNSILKDLIIMLKTVKVILQKDKAS